MCDILLAYGMHALNPFEWTLAEGMGVF